MEKVDLTGKIFGFLIVEGRDFSKIRVHWICKCICGKYISVLTAKLTRSYKNTKSCGCKRGYLIALKTAIDPTELCFREIYNDYKHSAKSKKINFELPFEYVKNILCSNCYYCNTMPFLEKRALNKLGTGVICYNGMDRKNNDLGYLITNIVPCCKICNYAKKAMKFSDFIEWIGKLHKNYEKLQADLQLYSSGVI